MATKPVATRRRIIRRPRLTKLLDESPARIKLLVAPAGYGKTTLAQEWLSEPERQAVWYRGGPASADVAALAASLSKAAAELIPDAGKRMRERIRSVGHPEEDVDVLGELFAEDVQEWPPNAWLAFDDYQFAMDSAASERFVDLLTQQTPIQLLITSRRRPSWATARRILYGEIQEIERRELAMEREEASRVLDTVAPIDDLIARASGWPAVLGMAALSSSLRAPADSLPAELYDFFAEELYRGASTATRRALHQLALMPAATPEIARLIFGNRTSEVLEDCARLGALEPSALGVSIHPLLRTFLNQRLARSDPGEIVALATQVTDFLISLSDWDTSFEVITDFSLSDRVVPLVEASVDALLRQGRTQTLLNWLDYAARSHVVDPKLDFAEAEVAFRQGAFGKAEALAAQAADSSPKPEAKMLVRAGQAAVMDSRDEIGLAYFRAARPIVETATDRLEVAAGSCFAALELGLANDAREALVELLDVDLHGIDAAAKKAVVQLMYSVRLGGVQPGLALADSVAPLLGDVKDPLVVTSFLNCHGHLLALGALYSEALKVADRLVIEGERYRLRFVLPHAILTRAVAYAGLRDFAKAEAQIEVAEELTRACPDIHVSMQCGTLRVRLALYRHDFSEARRRSNDSWGRSASAPMMSEYLAYRALVHASQGDADEARRVAAAARQVHVSSVETSTLAACAEAIAAVCTDQADAPHVVAAAYAEVQRTGGFDTLVTAGRAYPDFLRTVLATESHAAEVKHLLARSNDFRLAEELGLEVTPSVRGPIGGLTPRELEVAHLVGEGFTNRTIAARLFISESTVKVHVRHIREKINAQTRTEIALRISQSNLGDVR